jgi:hypothetical protein
METDASLDPTSRETTMNARPRLLMLLVLLTGCARPEPSSTATRATAAGSELDDAAWTQALVEHREENDESFRTSSTSPMAGTQRLQSDSADRIYLARQDRTFSLSYDAPFAPVS